VSGVSGGVTYEDGGGGRWVGFGGEVDEWRCWPNIGIGLVVTFGSGIGVAEVEAAAFAARFETICRE